MNATLRRECSIYLRFYENYGNNSYVYHVLNAFNNITSGLSIGKYLINVVIEYYYTYMPYMSRIQKICWDVAICKCHAYILCAQTSI